MNIHEYSAIITILILLLFEQKCFTLRYLTIKNSDFCSMSTKAYDIFRAFHVIDDNQMPNLVNLETNDDHSGVVVQQSWNYTNLKEYKRNCEFKVKNRDGNGMFVVIQKLYLRRNKYSTKCIDYIEFKIKDGKSQGKICGEIGAGLSNYSFFDVGKGDIKTSVHIESGVNLHHNEVLEIKIAYTSYFDCDSDSSSEEYTAINKPIECETLSGESKCISYIHGHDDIVNCPPPKCSDEDTCLGAVKPHEAVGASPSSIVLSAVTSLLFTMCGVATCLWMCFKYRECIQICAANQQTRDRNAISNIQLQTSQVPTNTPVVLPTPSEEKDLPPSYEELFGRGNQGSAPSAPPAASNSSTSLKL